MVHVSKLGCNRGKGSCVYKMKKKRISPLKCFMNIAVCTKVSGKMEPKINPGDHGIRTRQCYGKQWALHSENKYVCLKIPDWQYKTGPMLLRTSKRHPPYSLDFESGDFHFFFTLHFVIFAFEFCQDFFFLNFIPLQKKIAGNTGYYQSY